MNRGEGDLRVGAVVLRHLVVRLVHGLWPRCLLILVHRSSSLLRGFPPLFLGRLAPGTTIWVDLHARSSSSLPQYVQPLRLCSGSRAKSSMYFCPGQSFSIISW